MYISKSTGLLVGTTTGSNTRNFSYRQTFGAYRDFGGLLVATECLIASHVEATNFEQSIKIDELRWDSVPESEFELPEEVRALMRS